MNVITDKVIPFNYSKPRFWYHISQRYNRRGQFLFYPWGPDEARNRDPEEPPGIRIPVAPSIEQCLTALQLEWNCKYNVYRTEKEISVEPPAGIFDSDITNEGWVLTPKLFVRVGSLDMSRLTPDREISDAACVGKVEVSYETLEIWKKKEIYSHIKFSKNYDYLDI